MHPSGAAVNFMMANDKGVIDVAGEAEVVDPEALVPSNCIEEGDEIKPGDYIIVKAFTHKRRWGDTKVHKVYVFTFYVYLVLM